jgi:hypothetical protein
MYTCAEWPRLGGEGTIVSGASEDIEKQASAHGERQQASSPYSRKAKAFSLLAAPGEVRPVFVEEGEDRLQGWRGRDAASGLRQPADAGKHMARALDDHFHAGCEINAGCRGLGEPDVWIGVIEKHLPIGIEGIVSGDGTDADELEDGFADDELWNSVVVLSKSAERVMLL